MLELREYQSAAIQNLRSCLRRNIQRLILQAPTGSGKTLIAAAIIRSGVAKGSRVLFLAPRRELIYQCSNKLRLAQVMHGKLMAGEIMSDARVQVASIPTLYHRALRTRNIPLPPADLVIVDEAHLSTAKMARSVIEAYPGVPVIGLTATPARKSGKSLGYLYEQIVTTPNVRELTDMGYLVPARYFAPTKPDLSGIQIVTGDYHQAELGKRMQPLVGDVVSNWLRLGQNRRTVVFAVNVSHSLHLRDRFREVGVKADHIDGTTPNEERAEILRRIESGETQVIVNCDVLTYGWDSPSVSCAVLAKPTKSLVRYFQMVGRVLRPYEGKEDCLILDHAGSIDEIGFVDEPVQWTLDGNTNVNDAHRKQRESQPKEITCGDCGFVFMRTRRCPNCGEEIPAHRPEAQEIIDGDLEELDREKKRRNRKWTGAEKRRFYGELLWVASDKGYRSGWAANQYRAKLGVWPNSYKDAPMVQPTKETLAWVKHRQIKFAKSKQRKAA